MQKQVMVLSGTMWIVLLILTLPQFLHSPLHADPVGFDLQAENFLQGGTLYRELFETNPPGAVWIHLGVRSVAGKSWIALRMFDVLVLLVGLLLISKTVGHGKLVSPGTGLFLFSATFAYFSFPRWCHCQRDFWMLLPGLVALRLRITQFQQFSSGSSHQKQKFFRSVLEGTCWACSFWIKPHIIVPGAACVVYSWILAKPRGAMFQDLCGLVLGGLLIGATGCLFLTASGAWPYFWDTMWNWSSEYFRTGNQQITAERKLYQISHLSSWSYIHLFALPYACLLSFRAIRPLQNNAQNSAQKEPAFLAVLYLSFCFQAFFLQHPHGYVQVPCIILGIAVVSHWMRTQFFFGIFLFSGFLSIAVSLSPLLSESHRKLWFECFTLKTSPERYNQLSIMPNPDWEDLESVRQFLVEQQVQDQGLHCLHHFVLYKQLEIAPPVPYLHYDYMYQSLPSHREELLQSIENSKHRYVVSDLAVKGIPENAVEFNSATKRYQHTAAFPEKFRTEYPWNLPVVFQAGTILVHERPEQD